MKKIPASLQKMRYDKQGEIVQVVCLVDSVTKGGEYTLCGNAIPYYSLNGCILDSGADDEEHFPKGFIER